MTWLGKLNSVTDDVDQCLNARETYNRYQDEDGCPDTIPDNKLTPDSDGDNIPDYLDSCPNQPETYNGFQDADGCPDKQISDLEERKWLDKIQNKKTPVLLKKADTKKEDNSLNPW